MASTVVSTVACGAKSGLATHDDVPGLGTELDEDELEESPRRQPEFARPELDRPRGELPIDEAELCVYRNYRFDVGETTVMLLVDQSGSMNERFVDASRWDTLAMVLFDEQSGLLPKLQDSIRFGMMLYTSINGFSGGTCPILQLGEAGFGNVDQLRELYESNEPRQGGDTPTGEALTAAKEALQNDPTEGEKRIVLLTDGEPDTCTQPDPQRGQGTAVAAARDAYLAGFEVFTVGLSSDVGNAHLQEMSNVGQGRAVDLQWGVDADAAQPYRADDDPAELAEQLRGAIGYPRTCEFSLPKDITEAELSTALDDEDLIAGEDWVIEGRTLRLLGGACEAVKADAKQLWVIEPACRPE